MKITCKAKEFIRCVELLKPVVPLRSPLPALTGILIKEGPVMVAMNRQSGMSVTLDAEVESGGMESAVIPGRKVIGICNKIRVSDDDVVVLEVDDKAVLKIGKSRFTLKTLPSEHFPAFPVVPNTDKHYIPSVDLVRLLKNTVYATSDNSSTLYQCGVYLEGTDGKLSTVATDAKRFAIASVPYEGDLAGVLIPTAFAKVIISTFQGGDMWLTVDGTQLVCGQGDMILSSLLYEDKFPAEAQNTVLAVVRALPKSTICSKVDFANAVDMALLLSNPLDNQVTLNTSDVLNVSARHDAGDTVNVVAAEIAGEMELTAMSGVFVKNILATLSGENIVLKYDTPASAFLIHSQDDESVLGFLSPMRL